MNNSELAQLIQERFTPFAIKCGCKGTDIECQVALEDPAVWSQYNTVNRIVEYINTLGD